jgi:hypothetical protein
LTVTGTCVDGSYEGPAVTWRRYFERASAASRGCRISEPSESAAESELGAGASSEVEGTDERGVAVPLVVRLRGGFREAGIVFYFSRDLLEIRRGVGMMSGRPEERRKVEERI